MADLAPYADAEALLVAALAAFGDVGTFTPADLQDRLVFIQVRRRGGADDRITDIARVDVDVFAPTRAAAWQTARLIQQHLISAPLRIPGVGVIDRARTEVGPQEVPHADQRIRRVLTSYRLSSRRPA